MIHAITLALFVVLVVRDAFPLRAEPFPFLDLSGGAVALASLAPLAAIVALAHAMLIRCGRRIDRHGSSRAVRTAHTTISLARLGVLLAFAWAVLGVGWLDEVRAATGDLILLDEALALAPPVLALILLWASGFSIERRLHEAAVLVALERGRPIPGLPTRWQYVLDQSRFHLLLVLFPLLTLTLWWESVDRATVRLFPDWATSPPSATVQTVYTVVQYLGVLAILIAMPAVLVRVWNTVRLGPGELRSRLESLCRLHRVRVRDLLVWRTHNAMVNGALLGVLPPFRYILLTDALLSSLPGVEVEAVMAHEVAHARRHHLPWLIVTVLAAAGLTWTALALAAGALLPNLPGDGPLATAAVGLPTAITTFLLFGHVSRRFEEQADAFAVQHIARRESEAPNPAIDHAAADAMSDALGSVALLNHADQNAFSFRHGSIASRRKRIRALVGQRIDSLSIDRRVRRLKLAGLIGLALIVGLEIVQPF